MRWDWTSVILAFFITSTIFLTGFFLAEWYNSYKTSAIKADYRAILENLESMQLEEMYLEEREGSSCQLREYQVEQFGSELDRIADKLMAYQSSKEFSSEFFQLKTDYTLLQLRAWMTINKIKRECDSDLVTALYFFDLNCDSCEEQGYVLDHYKKQLGHKFMVFSIDRELYLPVIHLILRDHNITQTPALILDEKKHEGFTSKEELALVLCEEYREKPPFCA